MSKDYLVDCYKKYFKEILLPLGFKLKGRYFYRIVNGEVIQAVGIKKHRLVRSFTINFDFGVLCIVGDVRFLAKDFMGLSEVLYGDDIWWEFDPNDSNTTESIVKHVADEFKKILYLFSNIVDIQSYYDLIGDVEKRVFGDIIEDGKIMVCLKLKKYDEALEYIQHEEEYRKVWLEDKLTFCKEKSEELEFIKMAEEDFEPVRKIRAAILQKDYCYIDNLIKTAEDVSRQSCKDYLEIMI